MIVNYCDLCGSPLKTGEFYFLYCTTPRSSPPDPYSYEDANKYAQEYQSYVHRLEKEVKEICPQCKNVFDRIFELRMKNLTNLSNELLGIFEHSDKDNKPDKNKKFKK